MKRVASLAAVIALALAGTVAHALERPPALQQEHDCELWHGRGSGNDASMIDELRICTTGPTTFRGVLQHSSTEGGFGIRTVVGRIERRTHYVFSDTGYLRNEPAHGWHFCLVDHDGYQLDRVSPTHLSGTFDSRECRDHGTMDLNLVATGDGRTGLLPPRSQP